jgi:quercetin dioxygenase-like cupin family protein
MTTHSLSILRWEKPTPPTEQEAEARLHQEGYEVFKWHDVPGAEYPDHQHHCDECLWILAGTMTLESKDQTFTLQPGDRLFLPKDLPHRAIVPTDPSGVTYLVGQKRER